jgi:hypothetical protein
VVEIQSTDGTSLGPPVWFTYWMELDSPWRVSIEIDPDRAATISPAAWRRARQAFGPPLAIRVLDAPTARRVRKVVPARVTVTVTPDDRRLLEMTAAYDGDGDDDDDELDRPLRRALF